MITRKKDKEKNLRPSPPAFEKKEQQQRLLPQYDLSTYIKCLSQGIKNCKKVTNNIVLRSEKWSKNCYETLSRMIGEDLEEKLNPQQKLAMGTSISSKTLQKIIELNYKLTYPIDPRTLNTLNKVVIFLEYEDWSAFFEDINAKKDEKKDMGDPEKIVKSVVQEAIRREYITYCNLPEIQESFLSEIYIKNSPSYNMILDVLVDKSRNKQVLSNNYNPSTCEILDIEIKKIEHNYAQVFTKEFWLLCWWDSIKNIYTKRYKVISDHFYILNKRKGKWMIKTNASTSDPLEMI